MLESEQMNADDRELIEALKNLQPAAAGISSREIAFRAGLETARRQASRWRLTAVAMLAVAVLAVGWSRRTPRIVDHLVYVPTEPAAPNAVRATPIAVAAAEPSARLQYLKLCDEAMNGEAAKEIPPAAPEPSEFEVHRRSSREDPALEFLINDGLRDQGDGR